MLSHEEYKEMTAAHALDALELAEARGLEKHLQTCDECRREFVAWKETATTLAYAAETTAPPAKLRSRILQQARSMARAEQEPGNESLESTTIKDRGRSSNVIPLRESTRRQWSFVQAFGAIAALLIIVSLAAASIVLWKRNRAMENEMAELSRRVKESQQEIARLSEEKGLYTAPDARIASLKGTEMAKDAHAMLAYNHATGRAMLVANGLPPAPAGMAYQLWFIKQGKPPMPGGVFATDAAGHAEMMDMIPSEGRGDSVYAVTLERAGGVSAPEGKMYLQSDAS